MFITALTTFLLTYNFNHENAIEYITEETKAIIIKENDKKNEFSEARLKQYVIELNIKFPHIVIAQSQIETGYYSSKIFKENNNLFGMKVATQRPTTNKGTENNHAYYENWKASVIDYALYQAKYLSKLKTEDEYLQYLSQNYAEDPNYIIKVKSISKKLKKIWLSQNN
jgi:uncharacterized FlgJ-related protein